MKINKHIQESVYSFVKNFNKVFPTGRKVDGKILLTLLESHLTKAMKSSYELGREEAGGKINVEANK